MINNNVARVGPLLCFLAMILIAGCVSMPSSAKEQRGVKIEGRIDSGTYLSPGQFFRVDVPEMHNPFIKQPAAIWDENTSDGRVEVNFTVLDLGEAHRFGVRPLGDSAVIEGVFNEELGRWVRKWINEPRKAEIIHEEDIHLADGAGLARVYLVESASLLFRRTEGNASMRDSALIGVVVAPVPHEVHVLYVVSQFDMGNSRGPFTLETEQGREFLAGEHVRRMKELSETFRLQR